MNTKFSSGLAVATAAVIALSGCSYPGDDIDQAGERPSASSTPTQAPSKELTSQPKPTNTDETSETDKPLDLGDPKYVHGNDFASMVQPSPVTRPYFESWFIDGKDFTYTHKSCLGATELEVTGTIEDGELVWDDGKDPWPGDQTTATTPVEVTETEFNPDPISVEASTTDIEGEKKAFAGYCKARGEDVADVFIG